MEKAESDTIGGRILMLNIKRFLCLILAAVLCVGLFPASVSAGGSVPGLAHFAKSRIWSDDIFTDVSASDWFYGNVRSVYEYGLMIGKGENLFDPAGNVTLAETLTIAARLNAVYAAGEDGFEPGDPWYAVYADYCVDKGIIDSIPDEMNAPASRAEFASILAAALPGEAFDEKNAVADGAVPDVEPADSYGAAVYKLYRAGIVIGNDETGTFAPFSNIKRCEVAAILTRTIDPDLRLSAVLDGSETDSRSSDETKAGETSADELMNESEAVDGSDHGSKSGTESNAPGVPDTGSKDGTDSFPGSTPGSSTKNTGNPLDKPHFSWLLWENMIKAQSGKTESGSSEPTYYIVRFDGNAPDAADVPASQVVPAGGTAVKAEAPVRSGYRFNGWTKDPEGKISYDFTEPVQNDMTLYAAWMDMSKALAPKEPVPEIELEFPGKEKIEEELDRIAAANGGEMPEIVMDEEDMIPAFIMGGFSALGVVDGPGAIEALKDIQNMMRFDDPENEFVCGPSDVYEGDHSNPTRRIVLQQVYKGTVVYGKQLIVTTDLRGTILALSGDYDPLAGIMNETVALTAEEAYALAVKDHPYTEETPELVVFTLENGVNEYAWMFTGDDQVFVSAVDGRILLSYTNNIADMVPAIGRSEEREDGTADTFNTCYDDSDPANPTYYFVDSVRWVYYHDLKGKSSEGLTKAQLRDVPYLEDHDNIWQGISPEKAIRLYKNLETVYDYYLKNVYINSYDNRGGIIRAYINDGRDRGNNAFNSGTIVYDDARSMTNLLFGGTANYQDHLDVVTHEFTHALQDSLIESLVYADETGALMEAYSDIAGELAETYYYKNNDITEDDDKVADWNHNNRYLVNPGRTPRGQKANYPDTYGGPGSMTEVHHDSTIVSHVGYEIYWNALYDCQKMSELLYRAWRYLPGTADFVQYRMAVTAAARDMGLEQAQIDKIKDAFAQANINGINYVQVVKGKSSSMGMIDLYVQDDSDVGYTYTAIPGVFIKIYECNSDYEKGELVAEAITNGDGRITMKGPAGTYIITAWVPGYEEYTSPPLKLKKQGEDILSFHIYLRKSGSPLPTGFECRLSGEVYDWITDEGIKNARLEFHKGVNMTDGWVRYEYTDEDGIFSADKLEIGQYTVIVSAKGYVQRIYNISVGTSSWSDADQEQFFGLYPKLDMDDTIRVVLQWGQNPKDLDAHLLGWRSNVTPFDLSYAVPACCESDGSLIGKLDMDDLHSHGPETITFRWKEGADFKYYVHLFSGSGTLSTSEAKILIYGGNSLMYIVPVPEGSGDKLNWEVFTFRDGKFTFNNTFTTLPPSLH